MTLVLSNFLKLKYLFEFGNEIENFNEHSNFHKMVNFS